MCERGRERSYSLKGKRKNRVQIGKKVNRERESTAEKETERESTAEKKEYSMVERDRENKSVITNIQQKKTFLKREKETHNNECGEKNQREYSSEGDREREITSQERKREGHTE